MYLKIYLYDNYIQMSHMTYSMNYPNEVCDISQFILVENGWSRSDQQFSDYTPERKWSMIENVRETMFPDDAQECPWITMELEGMNKIVSRTEQITQPINNGILFNMTIYTLFFAYMYYNAEEGGRARAFMRFMFRGIASSIADSAQCLANVLQVLFKIGIKMAPRNLFEDSDKDEGEYNEDNSDEDTSDDDDNYKFKEAEERKPLPKYEDKYVDQYKKLEDVELSKDKLDSLKNSILMENTPLGNVVMFYDNSRETFTFYSDSTIPYRYLETIGRKYVVMNNCKRLYVDMEEEIKDAKESIDRKIEAAIAAKEAAAEAAVAAAKESTTTDSEITTSVTTRSKANVFAKLKTYNTNNIKIDPKAESAAAKNTNASASMNANTNTNTKNQANKVVKEKANRYSYEGKLINFNFLKKVDRKVVDKNYGMSFAEFKKSQKDMENKSS